MEISKGLQLEIQSVQSKLKNAIRDHQICVGKLKDDPNNPDILDRIQEIQVHIVSLGRCQKQVVQRLRKEVEDYKAVNANEIKVSVASLLGLNNNNHITANNETTNDDVSEVSRIVTNGLDNVRLTSAKEDYEDIVRNGDVASHRGNSIKKRSISVETISADDEEIIEVSVEEDTRDNKRQMSEEPLDERRIKCTEQLTFLEVLGLITTLRSTELQNRRAERKRRSTANPQFVYSNWDMPTKRKRHNYLQSAGNVPITRQTTARLNGPSPPPIFNKSANSIVPPKSTSPPTRTLSKSLIPTQKATTRPNILRNMSESRVFPNKSTRMENGDEQLPLTCTTTKTSQSTSNSKTTVHIPGLPSGLTIERIENDSPVCINCRNPGTLTSCENCEANYHVSCHSISPPPTRLCPKCSLKPMESIDTIKKNDELVAASYAPGVAGKAGEDPTFDKACRGFYKIGTDTDKRCVTTERCVNKLSGSSTFIIPIASNSIALKIAKSTGNSIALHDDEQPPPTPPSAVSSAELINVIESDNVNEITVKRGNNGNMSYSTSIVVKNQLSRSSVTYVPQQQQQQQQQSDACNVTYKLPIYDNEANRESLENDEIGSKTDFRKIREYENSTSINESRCQKGKNNDSKIVGIFDERKRDGTTFRNNVNSTSSKQQQQIDKLAGRLAETIARNWKKTPIRAIPGLTRIVKSTTDQQQQQQQQSNTSDNGNNDNVDESQKFTNCGESSTTTTTASFERRRFQRKYDTRNFEKSGDRNNDDDEFNGFEVDGKSYEITGQRKIEKQQQNDSLFSRDKYRTKYGNQYHSLFTINNKSDNIIERNYERSKQQQGTFTTEREDKIDNGENIEKRRNNDNWKKFTIDETTNGNCTKRYEASSSAEYVKLEEAHLSAPSRTNLMQNSNNEKSLISNDSNYRSEIANRFFPNRRRTTEDRTAAAATLTSSRICEFYDGTKFETRQMPRILMRTERRKSLDSRDISPNSFNRLLRDEASRISIKNAIVNNDETSTCRVIDDNLKTVVKLDDKETEINIEARDLNCEEFGIVENIERIDNLDTDEETEDNVEDIDDEEYQDCPIVDEEINVGENDKLRIGTVSPEIMQVLEQFENAMMQVENGDKNANP